MNDIYIKTLNQSYNEKPRPVLESMYSVTGTNSYNRFMKFSYIYTSQLNKILG